MNARVNDSVILPVWLLVVGVDCAKQRAASWVMVKQRIMSGVSWGMCFRGVCLDVVVWVFCVVVIVGWFSSGM